MDKIIGELSVELHIEPAYLSRCIKMCTALDQESFGRVGVEKVDSAIL